MINVHHYHYHYHYYYGKHQTVTTCTHFPGKISAIISSTPMITCFSRTFFPRTRFATLCCAPLTPAENPTGKGAMLETEGCACTTTSSNTCRKPSFIASITSESSVVIAKDIDWSLPSVKTKLKREGAALNRVVCHVITMVLIMIRIRYVQKCTKLDAC